MASAASNRGSAASTCLRAGLLDQRSQVAPQVGRALATRSARQQHAALRVEIGEGQRLARGVIEQGLRVALCQVGIAELEARTRCRRS